MADVTISQLAKGIPAGNNILPYSTSSNTLGVPVSGLFQNLNSSLFIGSTPPPVWPQYAYTVSILKSGYTTLIIGSTNGQGAVVWLDWGSNVDAVGGDYAGIYHQSDKNLIFYNVGAKMAITSGGNVGINTITPKGALQVNSDDTCGTLIKNFYVNYNTAPTTKYLKITSSSSGAFNLQCTLIGVYWHINAGGSYRKNFNLHYNSTTTNLYGYGASVAFNMGELSKYYSIGEASKPDNTTIIIPISRYSSVNGSNPNQLGISLFCEFGYGINSIQSIEIVDSL